MDNNKKSVEIKSKFKIIHQILILFVILSFFTIGSFFDFPFNSWKASLILSILLIIIFISNKRVEKISVKNSDIEITYSFWLRKIVYKTKLQHMVFKIVKVVSFRGGKRKVLQISEEGKILFEIDQLHGFKESDFEVIYNLS
jgi:hypothetical protein